MRTATALFAGVASLAVPRRGCRTGERHAITPTVYVTNFNDNTVTPIGTATNTPGTPIPVGQEPLGVAITPDGKTAYVANIGTTP